MLNSQSVLRNDVIVQHGEFEICLESSLCFSLRSGYSSVSFVWGIRVRVGVRVISLRDSFSVLLRPQHLSMLTTHGRKSTSFSL